MAMTEAVKRNVETALIADKGAVLEYVAKENGVTVVEIVSCLPSHQAVTISGDLFVDVMGEISTWGEITFLVHTDDVILEAKGIVPAGSVSHGYFNLHGKPIGGHLKADNCASISFISRPLFKSDSCSVQFYNKAGGCMFKIYLGRDDKRQLIPSQVAKFENYRDQISTTQ
ncbi:MAG: heme utilization cystosolic carrier protein HutX [Rhizobiales bacterium]|nr:heme utilization cystosolic carrier protein HutX [Hyphomicrobiales bacterium]